METMSVFQIQPGWTAYDVMAEKLGVAIEVGNTYVLVEMGPILPANLYIPLAHVSSVNGEETNFIVSMTKRRDREDGLAGPAGRW